MLKKNKSGEKNVEYWSYVEGTAAEVRSWPTWKFGFVPTSSPKKKALSVRKDNSGFIPKK